MADNYSFDFTICDEEKDVILDADITDVVEGARKVKQAEVVTVEPNLLNRVLNDKNIARQSVQIGDTDSHDCDSCSSVVQCLSVKYAESLVQNSVEFLSSETGQALQLNSDLVSSRYEGGLKIWECSTDLVRYLHDKIMTRTMAVHGKKVLELGCGAGHPGILCLMNGATVHFQDYNKEVLQLFTIPNIAMNFRENCKHCVGLLPEGISELPPQDIIELPQDVIELPSQSSIKVLAATIQKHCQFISGDWSSTSDVISPSSYDIILTSETIYNPAIQHVLYDVIKHSVKPDGVVLIAAKSYYFGVGGGTRQFEQLVRKDGVFEISTVKNIYDGVRREILQMKMTQ